MDPGTSKKVKQVRNWLELSSDVLSMIFIKLGAVEILLGPRAVCSVWRKLSKEPHLYRSIDLRNLPDLYRKKKYHMDQLAIAAVDRSSGQLVEFSIEKFATDAILRRVMEKSSLLRCFRIATCQFRSEKVMIEMAKKLPQLEELEICHCLFSTTVIETFGSSCLQLKSFRLNRVGYKGPPPPDCDDEALAIAKNFPELCHLNIFGNYLMDNGLRAILDGCPHLKSLDLRQCFNLLFEGDLKKRCADGNIKLRLPDDSTDDYEFNPHFNTCPGSDDDDYYYDGNGGLTSSDDEFHHDSFCDYYSLL